MSFDTAQSLAASTAAFFTLHPGESCRMALSRLGRTVYAERRVLLKTRGLFVKAASLLTLTSLPSPARNRSHHKTAMARQSQSGCVLPDHVVNSDG
jgi:hypothetical protein